MNGVLWLYVTDDIYELPVIVADSCEELARKCGVTTNNIYSTISHFRSGRLKTCRYVKVKVRK